MARTSPGSWRREGSSNVNTVNLTTAQVSEVKSQELQPGDQESEARTPVASPGRRRIRISQARRLVLFGIIVLFMLQFLKVKALVGGLSGSVAIFFVTFIDVFAYLERLLSSRGFTTAAFLAVLPVAGIYLIFGRAFCGWVCPMDFLFGLINKVRPPKLKGQHSSPKIGYGIAAAFLAGSFLIGIPLFTNYISHITNFFRIITGGVFYALGLPFEPTALFFSIGILASLLIFELFFPRLWCRVLCPIGKTYGLFNKVSLLRLTFVKGICRECNLCDQRCYMHVKIASRIDMPSLRDENCIYCGRCMEECETKGRIVKITLWRQR
jgi:ferredoxin-type protein NapH